MKPDATSAQPPLLEIRDLRTWFPVRRGVFSARAGWIKAVDGVSLALAPRETLGLVGESGCGKTTLARTVADLERAQGGEIRFKNEDLLHADAARRRALRRSIQMVFQDPYASLNPRLRVVDIVGEAPVVHGIVSRRQQVEYVGLQLNRVGLDPTLMRRFPHQFSGGQRARIGIARALAVKPEFLVCDESVAALDVSIQAQVLNLFVELKRALSLTYLFISHDLGVVRHLSDRVVVMYLGRVVESGPAQELFREPAHPYTRALLAEVGRVEARKRAFAPVRGEIPSPLTPPAGCHFHPRCPHVMPRCRESAPALVPIAPGRSSACWLDEPAPPAGP